MLKSLFLSLFLFFGSLSFGLERSAALFDSQGNPSKALLEILEDFGIEHEGNWSSIVSETQKKWLKSNIDRWEMEEIFDPHPKRTYFLFSNLSMTQSLFPERTVFVYAAIHGGTVQLVRQRFWFLKKLWEEGVRFENLVILTGDRPLSPLLENEKELCDPKCSPFPFREGWKFEGSLPQNETEMTKLVFDQLDLPLEWRQMDVLFVDTPKPYGKSRPTTADTLSFWLEKGPKPGTFLGVGSQPFLGREDATERHELPETFEIETVGPGFSFEEFQKEKRALAILLDELARWIYEEQIGARS